jgi:hypothetical protein
LGLRQIPQVLGWTGEDRQSLGLDVTRYDMGGAAGSVTHDGDPMPLIERCQRWPVQVSIESAENLGIPMNGSPQDHPVVDIVQRERLWPSNVDERRDPDEVVDVLDSFGPGNSR